MFNKKQNLGCFFSLIKTNNFSLALEQRIIFNKQDIESSFQALPENITKDNLKNLKNKVGKFDEAVDTVLQLKEKEMLQSVKDKFNTYNEKVKELEKPGNDLNNQQKLLLSEVKIILKELSEDLSSFASDKKVEFKSEYLEKKNMTMDKISSYSLFKNAVFTINKFNVNFLIELESKFIDWWNKKTNNSIESLEKIPNHVFYPSFQEFCLQYPKDKKIQKTLKTANKIMTEILSPEFQVLHGHVSKKMKELGGRLHMSSYLILSQEQKKLIKSEKFWTNCSQIKDDLNINIISLDRIFQPKNHK